ncbi:MAG: hypothetical protein ABSB56_06295 [Nitrososphaerales archaeon]
MRTITVAAENTPFDTSASALRVGLVLAMVPKQAFVRSSDPI